MRRPIRTQFVVVLFALAAAACGDSAADSAASPTSPTVTTPIVTETFSGTLPRNGATTWPFTTAAAGTVTATLTTVSPNGTAIGLSLGTWNGSACQIIIANDRAVVGTVVTGAVTAAGSLCVRTHDATGLPGPADYVVTVVHP